MNQQTHTTPENSEIKFNMANFDIENLDFDDMNFKPVTDGLGFHDDRAEKKTKTILRTRGKVRAPAPRKKAPNPVHKANSTTMQPMESKTINQKDIYEAFYGRKDTIKEETTFKEEEVEMVEATPFLQAGAWVIDVLFLVLAVAFTGGLFALVSGFDLNTLLQILPGSELAIFGAGLFILYYLFYFSVLDLGSSPGKAVMGIRLMSLDSKEMRIQHTFTRALISLISFVALGVPLFMDFQGKLSDTKLAKI